MRTTSSSLRLALALLLPLGCISVESSRKTLPEGMHASDLKTKHDLLANLGGPSNVIGRGDMQIWVYTHTLGGGGGFGVGNYALAISFANVHLCADTAIFLLGADGTVLQSRLLRSTDHIHPSIWPF
jgi:hypothetical protein